MYNTLLEFNDICDKEPFVKIFYSGETQQYLQEASMIIIAEVKITERRRRQKCQTFMTHKKTPLKLIARYQNLKDLKFEQNSVC